MSVRPVAGAGFHIVIALYITLGAFAVIQAKSYIGQPIFSPGTVIGGAVFGGSVTSATTTTFTTQSSQGDMRVVFKGTFTVSGGVVTGGTVEAFTAFAGNTKVVDAKGYSLNAASLYTAIQTDDYGAIEDSLFNVASKLIGSKLDDRTYGSEFDDKLLGKDGNDELYGWFGDDVLSGGKGNDLLSGEAGHDVLKGGKGNDVFFFQFDSALPQESHDKIKDFKHGQDIIELMDYAEVLPTGYLSKSYFHVGKEAKSVDQVVIYDKKNGKIYYDADGSEAGDQMLIAKVKADTKLHADDFFIGSGMILL